MAFKPTLLKRELKNHFYDAQITLCEKPKKEVRQLALSKILW